RVAALYVVLGYLTPSPVVELNRAVAVGMAYGPARGLEIADRLTGHPALASYAHLPAVRGDLLAKLGRAEEAREEFGRAAAMTGDSIGYLIGHRAGSPLFDWLGRKFPRHFGPGHVALAERVFTRHGVWAVFFGRFIALLRIFAGPLAGSLRMPYGRFLAAN